MFGEKDIYGITNAQIDDKGRLFIPTFTKVEPKEELVISKPNDMFLKVICLQKLNAVLKCLKSQKSRDNITQMEIQEIENQIEAIVATTICVAKVDLQRRIQLPKITREIFFTDKKIVLHGAIDHLRIFKNLKVFEQYTETIQKRNQF